MIYVIDGKAGHGKTAYTVDWARRLLKSGERIYSNTKINPEEMFSKRKFRKIFGVEKRGEIDRLSPVEGDISKAEDRENSSIRILYWQNFSDWQYMTEGTVICDEGIVYFNARRWEELPNSMQMKFVQHRKDKLDLIVNVQHYSFIDKTLRMLCEAFIHIELKFGSSKFQKTFFPRIARVSSIDLPTLNRCENMGIDPYNMMPEDRVKLRLDNISQSWFWIKSKIFHWYNTGLKMVESRPEELIHSERTCGTCGKPQIRHS